MISQTHDISERERESYRLTSGFANRPSSAGRIINQSTVDVDESTEIGDTVGVTISKETVAAVNGEQTLLISIVLRMRPMQILFLIIFRQ